MAPTDSFTKKMADTEWANLKLLNFQIFIDKNPISTSLYNNIMTDKNRSGASVVEWYTRHTQVL